MKPRVSDQQSHAHTAFKGFLVMAKKLELLLRTWNLVGIITKDRECTSFVRCHVEVVRKSRGFILNELVYIRK